MKRVAVAIVMTAMWVPLLVAMGSGDAQVVDGFEVKSVEVRGSVTPDGTELRYAGNGVWRDVVTLDKPVGGDYRTHSIYFTINGVDTLRIQRVAGTDSLLMPWQTGKREPVRLNNGVYDISLDLNKRVYSIMAEVNPYKISVFGSSVANGQGATDFKGYAYLYGRQLEKRFNGGESVNPFQVSGVSIGGNTTVKLLKRYDDLINDFGHYVIIGLSLGNEGIHNAVEPEKIFEQFRDNMLTLIARVREDGKVPVVVNNYTRGDYDERDYSYIKRMNLLIHQWDVPSVNVLGAIDDGAGHWAEGYIADRAHPNTAGHEEFMCAIVPSLFDALKEGKPLPQRDMTRSYMLKGGNVVALSPEGNVHPFTVSVRIKGSDTGKLLSFSNDADSRSSGYISVVDDGAIAYSSPTGGEITSCGGMMSDGEWHDVTLTHYYALGKTLLYVDDCRIGETDERLTVGDIYIGDKDNARTSRSVSEIFFWRSALSPEEISAHHEGAMLKSSLEIYSPLNPQGQTIENLAQSMNRAVLR